MQLGRRQKKWYLVFYKHNLINLNWTAVISSSLYKWCFLNRFRITFCAFQEGPRPNRHLQDILFLRGATCVAFYVIALMGNSCSVKSEIVLNYCEAGNGNWHYVKTPHHQFACQQHTSKSAETNWNHLKTHSGEKSNKCNQILLCTVYTIYQLKPTSNDHRIQTDTIIRAI